MKTTIIGLILLGSWSMSIAQSQTPAQTENPRSAQIGLITRADKDSVVLRWAPTKAGAWVIANRIGYAVDRVRVNKDGSLDPGGFQRLTPQPLKPWSQQEWLQRSERDNNYAAIALQALHGKAFIPNATDKENMNALRNAADELSNRYSFSLFAADNNATAAEGLALRYVDRNVKAGERYVYRVFVAGIDSSYSIDTAYAVVDVRAFQAAPPPSSFTAEGLDGRIVLRWEEVPERGYSGYFVYRSEDGGKTYTQLNKTPFVNVTPDQAKNHGIPRFADTTIVNYRKYRYAVRGVTPFGELSAAAETDASGRDLTPPGTPLPNNPELGPNRVKLTWTIKDPDPDLAGFVIARSPNTLGAYQELLKSPLPKSAREYVDSTLTMDEAYYIIGAVDTAGNVSPSLPVYAYVVDSIPPAVPKGLRGKIDTLGVVRLSWNLGPESDIIGYRVLRANDPRHEFAQLTPKPWKDTTFVDTVNLHTLTEYVYYRIAAIDKRYNHSELSAPLVLRRPDRVAPEAPMILDVAVTDSMVKLTWAPSTSEDVASHSLERRLKSGGPWQRIAKLGPHANTYTDEKVIQNTMYEYRVEAIDSTGFHSGFAMNVQARPYDTGVRPGVDSLRASYNQKSKSITLRWDFKGKVKEKFWFVVYRASDGYQLAQYRSVDNKQRMFEDKNLNGKGTYRYAVKLLTPIGESPLSRVVQVTVAE